MNSDDLRLIDANANRAREGIRTAEDFIRFKVVEARWSAKLKVHRHSISQQLGTIFSSESLTGARNVSTDPLKPLQEDSLNAAASENPKSVAHRGLKRAQEALRVLEEYLRAEYPAVSKEFSLCRYSLYEAEQWLLNASDSAIVLNASTVYVLLTESLCKHGLMKTAEATLKGGCRLIQLREKERSGNEQLKQAHGLQTLCRTYGAVLICNDRLDISLASGSAGVHLGQTDLPTADVRRIAGEKLLIGRSTHSVEQARQAVFEEQADYIGIGSMYETPTKAAPILRGPQLAEEIAGLNLPVPVFAIGGIKENKLKELKAAGVRRIAVSTAVIADVDPESATRRLIEAMGS